MPCSASSVRQITRNCQKVRLLLTFFIQGAYVWSWAQIRNNGAVPNPGINHWNESQDNRQQNA